MVQESLREDFSVFHNVIITLQKDYVTDLFICFVVGWIISCLHLHLYSRPVSEARPIGMGKKLYYREGIRNNIMFVFCSYNLLGRFCWFLLFLCCFFFKWEGHTMIALSCKVLEAVLQASELCQSPHCSVFSKEYSHTASTCMFSFGLGELF